jgi:hypothetical protein
MSAQTYPDARLSAARGRVRLADLPLLDTAGRWPAPPRLNPIQAKSCWVEKKYPPVVTWRRLNVSNSSPELRSLSIRWLIERRGGAKDWVAPSKSTQMI